MRVRRDKVHASIVNDLTSAGASVVDLAMVGNGCPDIAVGMYGITLLVELKSDAKTHKRKGDGRAQNQLDFAAAWRGTPVLCATTSDEILIALAREVRIGRMAARP